MRATLVRTLVLCLALAVAPAAASARSGSNAGPFSILSGETKQAQEDPRLAWRMRVEAARQRYEAFAARAEEMYRAQRLTRLPRASSAPFDAPEPLTAALDDPTLRYNDMIVAADGVLVFRGPEGARHSAADFERLPDARVRALSVRIIGAEH